MKEVRTEHAEQIERWAEYVRTHRNWKQKVKPFIDAQILIARRFYKKLAETPEGVMKIRELRRIPESRFKATHQTTTKNP